MGQIPLKITDVKKTKFTNMVEGGVKILNKNLTGFFEDLDYELNISLSTTYKNCEMWGLPGHT